MNTSYNCDTSGVEKVKRSGGIFSFFQVRHNHPPINQATIADLENIVYCREVFKDLSKNLDTTNQDSKNLNWKCLAAACMDEEILKKITTPNKAETTECATQTDEEDNELVIKRLRLS